MDLRIFKIVMASFLLMGSVLTSHAFGADNNADLQKAVSLLQAQIKQSSEYVDKALASQQSTSAQSIQNLHDQIQQQIAHLQLEMQQLETQLTNEIKAVQTQVQTLAKAK